MSHEYLLQIPGVCRYDVPCLVLNGKNIIGWTKFSNKIGLSLDEIELIKATIKKTHHGCNMSIEKSNAILSKLIDPKSFNLILKKFIEDFRICKKCKHPELRNFICNGCGYNSKDLSHINTK